MKTKLAKPRKQKQLDTDTNVILTKTKHITYLEIIVFIASVLFFGRILFYNITTDIQAHLLFIQKISNDSHKPPANFIYYLTVYIFATFSVKGLALYISSIIVLSLSMAAKFTVTRMFCANLYQDDLNDKKAFEKIVLIFSTMLLIVFSLPLNSSAYIGQIPPNIWHNSTTIFLMPFAIALFWVSYKQLRTPAKKRIHLITILCLLNVLIKPSFFFVFLVSYPLMLIKCFGFNKRALWNLSPIFITSIVLIAMYYIIYKLPYKGALHDSVEIVIRPFSAWKHYSSNIPLSLLYSLIFPIAYLIFYPKDLIKRLVLQHAVIGYIIAILIGILFSETGRREFHGNFFWQCIICAYILFMVISALFAAKIKKFGITHWKNIIILAAFALHFIAGVQYLARIVYLKKYL